MLDLHPPFSKQIEAGTALPEGGEGCNTPPPNNSNVGQSWSKWNWYLLKVGQNGTDICLKFKVKVGKLC